MPADDKTADAKLATASEMRRHLRRRVIWAARVSCNIGDRPCTVFNISRGGALIKLDATLDRCSTVDLTIPAIGRLRGFVVWSNHDRAGIQFSDLTEALGAALDRVLQGRRHGA